MNNFLLSPFVRSPADGMDATTIEECGKMNGNAASDREGEKREARSSSNIDDDDDVGDVVPSWVIHRSGRTCGNIDGSHAEMRRGKDPWHL